MSGGSYSYLYCKDIDELFNSRTNLQEMADDLFAKYPQSQAAHDTRTLLELFNMFDKILEERKAKLEQVWRAQEWYRSVDSDEDYVVRELWNYEHPAPDAIRKPSPP